MSGRNFWITGILSVGLMAASHAHATGTPIDTSSIQMLPPSACPSTSGLLGVLSWDGNNPLGCVSGFTADTTGNVAIQKQLSVYGTAEFFDKVGIGGAPIIDSVTGLAPAFTVSENLPGQTTMLVQNKAADGFSEIKFMDYTGVNRISIGYENAGILGNYINTEDGGPLRFYTYWALKMSVTDNGVGINTDQPQATLDVNGFARLARFSGAPTACSSATDGSIALTHRYQLCACNGGSSTWVKVTDGVSACSW